MIKNINKNDIVWSYCAKFFSIGTGFVTLPLILHMLTPEEIGMNYLMITISSMIGFLDFGFSPQFGRNFTYVSSGAQELKKEGIAPNQTGKINYRLLSTMIETAKFVYRRLALVSLFFMLLGGTAYIYYITNGFSKVKYSLVIWLIFCLSTYFSVYFDYYISLLTGSGMIAEANKANIYSKFVNIILTLCLLLFHCGLFAVVIANLITPFISRFYSYRCYFTEEKRKLLNYDVSKQEIYNTFKILWYNAKKLGVSFISGYLTNKMGLFIVGFYLSLKEVAQYGLMVQLATILLGVATTLFYTFVPKFSSLRIENNISQFKILLSSTMLIYLLIMIVGGVVILFLCPSFLCLIKSKTSLPPFSVTLLYLVVVTLEYNHSCFAALITTKNEIPFVKSGIYSSLIILVFTIVSLQYTKLGLLGVVLSQFIVQIAYNNWKWPLWVFRDLHMSLSEFMYLGYAEIFSKIKKISRKNRKL